MTYSPWFVALPLAPDPVERNDWNLVRQNLFEPIDEKLGSNNYYV